MPTIRTIFAPPPRPPGTHRLGVWLDAHDPNPLCSGSPGLLGEAGQVARVAGEQDNRPGLIEGDHGEKRIERALVTRQPGPSEQLASCTPLLLIDRNHRDPPEHAMQASIPGAAAQNLGQRWRGGDDVATPSPNDLEEVPRPRIATGQLDETLGIQNQ
jgi:hypothetical protein